MAGEKPTLPRGEIPYPEKPENTMGPMGGGHICDVPKDPREAFLIGENSAGAEGLMSAERSEKLGKMFFLTFSPHPLGF